MMIKETQMINDIRNEAEKRNLTVVNHKVNHITVTDPNYRSVLGTNGVRIECHTVREVAYIKIGFTSFHTEDYLRDCSDFTLWDGDKNAEMQWAKRYLNGPTDFFKIFDRIKDDWKQVVYIKNTISDAINFIARDWYNCFATGNERFITRERLDMIDDTISLNDPLPKNNWREHVVPCKVLMLEAKRIFLNGGFWEDIAKMLHDNLVIVNIHESDARRLDGELGLRESMPEGWEFGDSIFARLDEAKINY